MKARIEWKIAKGSGHGEYHSISDLILLAKWVSAMNGQYGRGTHWMSFEERTVKA